jgi:hypothetical protein
MTAPDQPDPDTLSGTLCEDAVRSRRGDAHGQRAGSEVPVGAHATGLSERGQCLLGSRLSRLSAGEVVEQLTLAVIGQPHDPASVITVRAIHVGDLGHLRAFRGESPRQALLRFLPPKPHRHERTFPNRRCRPLAIPGGDPGADPVLIPGQVLGRTTAAGRLADHQYDKAITETRDRAIRCARCQGHLTPPNAPSRAWTPELVARVCGRSMARPEVETYGAARRSAADGVEVLA